MFNEPSALDVMLSIAGFGLLAVPDTTTSPVLFKEESFSTITVSLKPVSGLFTVPLATILPFGVC